MKRFVSASRITRKRHGCTFPPLGARTAASRIFQISSSGTGSGRRRRIDRNEYMISKSPGSLMVASSGVEQLQDVAGEIEELGAAQRAAEQRPAALAQQRIDLLADHRPDARLRLVAEAAVRK